MIVAVLMLPFLALLCSFAAGQFVAWRNMLRGRFALGFLQFALLFFLADVLLVLHFVADDRGTRWTVALWCFLGLCALSVAEYLFHAIRARSVKFRESQARQYGEAMDAFLRRQDDEALRGFRRVWRRDPWDSAAALMVGTLERAGRAERCLRRARARAEDPRLRDEIDEELRWRRRAGQRQSRARRDEPRVVEPAPTAPEPTPAKPGPGQTRKPEQKPEQDPGQKAEQGQKGPKPKTSKKSRRKSAG